MTIDLRSDTVTRPSEAMRDAGATADVGDDVYGDDPTVNELERRAADLVGMEAALFVPTGTMGNQVAVRTHTDRGQELVCDEAAHVYKYELGGVAQLSGLQSRIVDCGERCVPTPTQVREAHVDESLHRPGTGLLCLESTHNARGGVAVPKDHVDAAARSAHERDVPVHLDGARLFNACVARDVDPAAMVAEVDSAMFCLSKGLGAPVGSVLAGPAEFVDRARRTRKLLGGGMRQAGIVAGPGLEALDNVDRLAEDHDIAARLAAGLSEIDGLGAPDPDTNIVMLDTSAHDADAEAFASACADAGVAFTTVGPETARLCTHLDVDRDDVETALDRIASVAAELGD